MMLKYYHRLRHDYLKRLRAEGVDISDKSVSLMSAWMCVCTVLVIPRPDNACGIGMKDAYVTATQFTVLYIHIDNYLDSTDVSRADKALFLSLIHI